MSTKPSNVRLYREQLCVAALEGISDGELRHALRLLILQQHVCNAANIIADTARAKDLKYDKARDEFEKAQAERDEAWAEFEKAGAEYFEAVAKRDEARAEYNKAVAKRDAAWAEYRKASGVQS